MRSVVAIAVGCLGLAAAMPADCAAQSLNGSGSSFIGPMMGKWARDYEKAKGVKINYNPVGSGSGIRQFSENETDFGCTDTPLTSEHLRKAQAAGEEVLHIPLVLGGVVPAYNLPEVKEPLRFTGPVLADIFLGNIKNWNDPAIKEINAGVDLPSLPVVVFYRSDASGTSAIFTDYLAKVSRDWQDKAGAGASVKWPTGQGRRGNEELAAAVKATPGAIGYVELIYALQKRIPLPRVKNKEGNFVPASLEGVTAAAAATLKEVPADLRFSLTNAPGKDTYPISGATWAIVYAKVTGDRGQRLKDFLTWATHDGQDSVTDLYYARLPKELVDRVEVKLQEIKTGK
jgi:phosphate transport system substrate-binding protein